MFVERLNFSQDDKLLRAESILNRDIRVIRKIGAKISDLLYRRINTNEFNFSRLTSLFTGCLLPLLESLLDSGRHVANKLSPGSPQVSLYDLILITSITNFCGDSKLQSDMTTAH